MNRFSSASVGIALALCAGLALGQASTSEPETSAAKRAREREQRAMERGRLNELDEAWQAGDFEKVKATLDAAWESDRAWALRSCSNLLLGDDVSARPLGLAQLVAHATTTEIVSALSAIDPSRARAERRTLAMLAVPVFAAAEEDDFRTTIDMFLKDQDRVIRAAGATAIAHRKDPAYLEMLLPMLRESPTFKPTWDGDEEDILQSRLYGAFEAILGVRVKSAPDARAVLQNQTKPAPSDAPPSERGTEPGAEPSGEPPATAIKMTMIRGKPYFEINRFAVSFEFAEGRKGDERMARAVGEFASPASEMIAAIAEPIFGPLTIASPRLIIADKSRYSAVGGNSFRPGSGTGNEIALLESLPQSMAATVVHECVHVYHGASFEEQPRWFSEGLAESLSMSGTESMWNDREVRRRNFDDELEKGVFAELLGWKGPASSGDRENRLYAMAHLAVDFLRYGPHSAPEARLHLFMARIGTNESERSALEKLYGGDVKELDRRLAEWAHSKE